MADPFRPDTKSQLLREAQIGLSIVAILLAVLVYVAFYRLTGRGQHIPDHVRDAPVAKLVWPHNSPQPGSNLQLSNQPIAKITPPPSFDVQPSSVATNFSATKPENVPASNSVYTPPIRKSSMEETKTSRPAVPLVNPNFEPPKKPDSQFASSKPISNFPALPIGAQANPDDPNDVTTNVEADPKQMSFPPIETKPSPDSNLAKLKETFGPLVKSLDRLSPKKTESGLPKVERSIEASPGGVQLASMESDSANGLDSKSNNQFVLADQSFKPLAGGVVKPESFPALPTTVTTTIGDEPAKSPPDDPFAPPIAKSESNSFAVEPSKPIIPSPNSGFVPNSLRTDQPTLKPAIVQSPVPIQNSQPSNFVPIPKPLVTPGAQKQKDSKPPTQFRKPGSTFGDANSNRAKASRSAGFVEISTTTKQALKYTVEPGDSFLTIADKVYGDTRYFRALYKYNEPTVPDFDKLNPGTVIDTPLPSDLAKIWKDLCPPIEPEAKATNERSARTAKASTKIYVTRTGDTLFSIALENLDQASRYTEILELNSRLLDPKDSNSTPLRAGLRLVLPVK